jgi:hypothetical protein
MKLDLITKEVLLIMQEEYAAKGIEISIQELAEVCASQFTVANMGFKKGVNIRLPFFGTVTRKFGIEMGRQGRELAKLKGTIPDEEYKAKVLDAKIANKAKSLERRKKDKNTTFTLDDLRKIPNLVRSKKKYDDLV